MDRRLNEWSFELGCTKAELVRQVLEMYGHKPLQHRDLMREGTLEECQSEDIL